MKSTLLSLLLTITLGSSIACTYSLQLTDSWGDGWNGASLTLNVNSVNSGTYTFSNGSSANYNFTFTPDASISFNFTPGSYPEECSWVILDESGIVVCSGEGSSFTNPVCSFSTSGCTAIMPPPTEEDCLGAISICQEVYHNPSGSYGTGTYSNEINVPSSECLIEEVGGNWYTFSPQTSGILRFTISPDNASGEDYDWVLFDLSNASCSDLSTGDPYNYMMSASAAGSSGWGENQGPTGISTPLCDDLSMNCTGPGAGSWNTYNPDVNVVIGGTYMLYIAQFDGAQGYTVDFSPSIANLYDNIPPTIISVDGPILCGASQFTFQLSENVMCASVDDSEFYLNGPGGPYTLSNVTSTSCDGGLEGTTYLTANVTPAITASGTYTIGLNASVAGSIFDLCGNTAPSFTFDFTVDAIQTTMSLVNETCVNSNDGSATVTINSGGTSPYTYQWSNSVNSGSTTNTSHTNSNIGDGTYSVTVTDAGGCIALNTITLTNPTALTVSATSADAICGSANGSITATISNGTGVIDYVWYATSGGSTTNGSILDQANPYTISGLLASTYQVDITDANGCTASTSVVVSNSGGVNAGFSITANQCLEGNSFDFTDASGMTTGVSYQITSPSLVNSTVAGTPSYTGFVANAVGVWTVTQNITSGSCSDSETHTFEVYAEPVMSQTHQDVSCNGFTDGYINASSTITGTYTMLSGTGSFVGSTASSLGAGTYTFMISTANTCDDTLSVTINEPNPIVLSTSFTDLSCGGTCDGTGSVAVASGGVGPFSYNWGAFGNTSSLSGLCAATYPVTVTDGHSVGGLCVETASITVHSPVTETYTQSSVMSNCGQADGSATVNITTAPASSSYTITWYNSSYSTQLSQVLNTSNTSHTLPNIASGLYHVVISNASNCTDTIDITVNDTGSPTVILDQTTHVLCNGASTGSFEVHLGGTLHPNFTYECYKNGVLHSTVGPTPSTTNTQSSLGNGNYTLVVTAIDGCQSTISTTINQPEELIGNITPEQVICLNLGSAMVQISGGTTPYSYQWNDANAQTTATAQDLAVGNYACTITDSHLCTLVLTTSLVDLGFFDSQVSHQDVSCNGLLDGSITISPISGTAPFSYAWSDALGQIYYTSTHEGLLAGTYTGTVTDVNGCTSTQGASITEPTELLIQSYANPTTCFGYQDGYTWVDATGGTLPYTYHWSNGGAEAYNLNLTSNYYNVTVLDAHGCSKTNYGILVTQPNAVVLDLSYVPVICIGQSTDITISATSSPYSPYTYYWNGIMSNDVISVNPVVTTTYHAQVEDAHGCMSPIESVTVQVNPPLSITATPDKTVICKGYLVQVDVEGTGGNGHYQYSMLDGTVLHQPIELSPEQTTTYGIVLSDDCGSPTDTAYFVIEVKLVPVPSFHADFKNGCVPLEIQFVQDVNGHEQGTSYLWNFGDQSSSNLSFESSPEHIYRHSGTFDVGITITTPFGCVITHVEPQYITAFPVPESGFRANPSVSSILNPEIYFENLSQGADYAVWFFGDGDSSSTYHGLHRYQSVAASYQVDLVAVTRYGCKDTSSQRVMINEAITLYMPTAFSPDGDYQNELFMVKGVGLREEGFLLSVYDRWGEVMFETTDLHKGWDGKSPLGVYVKPGVYSYIVKVVDTYGVPHEQAGAVNVMR